MFRRLIEARLQGARRVASNLADGIDDRSRLFLLELAQERTRLTRLIAVAIAAAVVATIACVWATAVIVALAWPTEWRTAALFGTLAFWVLGAATLIGITRAQLAAASNAFQFSRQVAADDLARLREEVAP